MSTITATITATINGEVNTMNHEYELLLIDVSHEFNRIPTATLKFIDGNFATKKFRILDDPFFEIGKEINVALKYEGENQNEKNIFSGVIYNKLLELNIQGPTLSIELSDKAIRMHSARKNAVYMKKSDSDIFTALIDGNGLKAKSIEATNIKHTQMVQHYATDWDFLVSRAEANAKVVQLENGEVSVFQPKLNEESNSLELGLDEMYDFDLQINGAQQFEKVNAVGWDVTTQNISNLQEGMQRELFKHNRPIAKAPEVFGTTESTLVHAAHLDVEELKVWSEAQALKNNFSYIQGRVQIPGSTMYRLGESLKIKDLSDSFSGMGIISGIRHEVTTEGWSTHLEIGMGSCWLTTKSDVIDAPAAGLLPGVNGLQIGVIKTNTKDSENLFRIPVFIPAFGAEQKPIWARLATLDAGKNRGAFFIPEPGDEVIVGFLNDDPRQAIIVGSVFSPVNNPPADFQVNKNSKGIFTKSNYQLFFDEEKKQISIATSVDNKIVINENEQSITVSDGNKNKIKLSKAGIQLSSDIGCEIISKGDLKIKADGDVSITGRSVDLT